MNLKILNFLLLSILISCKQEAKTVMTATPPVVVPTFSADSAYAFIEQQVAFGPRVPNTLGHQQCADYLAETLERFGAEVMLQKAQLRAFNGTILNATNIIGAFRPDLTSRVLLFAHWDTRPWSDNDPDPANYNTPVIGANDGGSGVGVLLEVARQLGQQLPEVGVDIIFFDAEDYGAPESFQGNAEHTWCLGSQHWAKNPHVPNYRARYGILLDMVGARNATFYREQFSDYYAPDIVRKVWGTARSLGFEGFFVDRRGGAITDDHLYVNRLAGIPSINIIEYNPNSENGFGAYWHTITDDMRNIDRNTLFAVGTTVLHVVYNERK